MRLLDTSTGKFAEFFDLSNTPPYAILSHTWDRSGEQAYDEVVEIQKAYDLAQFQPSTLPDPSPSTPPLQSGALQSSSFPSTPPLQCSIWDANSKLSEKVRKACEIARRDGYRYIWIDSSCINKTSSSELSEAINSMFAWYHGAQICYAFLADVPSNEDVRAESSKFRESRWFKRAWTLQELVAPRVVVFLSQDWEGLGTKDSLVELVKEITHIDRAILTHERALAEESVAKRMRWAAEREATRLEDEAYSLLGIFGISMPTLYGEGRHAFQRLQEEIIQRIPDQSLFAWGPKPRPISIPLLGEDEAWITTQHFNSLVLSPFAPSPHVFEFFEENIIPISRLHSDSLELPDYVYTPTPYGIRTQLRLIKISLHLVVDTVPLDPVFNHNGAFYLAIFGSQVSYTSSENKEEVLARLCYVGRGRSTIESLLYVMPKPRQDQSLQNNAGILLSISPKDLLVAKDPLRLQTRTIYLPRPEPLTLQRRLDSDVVSDDTAFRGISLSEWTHNDLWSHGYTILEVPQKSSPHSHTYVLRNATSPLIICIRYRHILHLKESKQAMATEARVWIISQWPNPVDSGNVQGIRISTPPYTSAIWADERPWTVTLPPRRVHLAMVTEPGRDKVDVTLQLGLEMVASSHYRIHIDVTSTPDGSGNTATEWSTRAIPQDLCPIMRKPHMDVKLTMLGSVRQSLEMRGYSVRLEDSGTHMGSSLSLSLLNAYSGFTISIKYYHMLRALDEDGPGQEIVVAARVALESSSDPSNTAPNRLQGGPYVVLWADSIAGRRGWDWSQPRRVVRFTTTTGDLVIVRLGLDLAWLSEYYLLVDIEHNEVSSLQGELPPDSRRKRETYYMLHHPHSSIALTLPGHVKRNLQERGYSHIKFETPSVDHPNQFLLTLSEGCLTIAIGYSYHISTIQNGNQELTFRACTKVLSQGTRIDAPLATELEHDCQIMEWDAWQNKYRDTTLSHPAGWYWNLPWKDVTLITPTGLELTLRLGFYLVWLGEYCITVEVNPHSSLSHQESAESLQDS